MPAPDREAVFQSVRTWLQRTNPTADAMQLGPDTDIIEARILESLQVVEFILFLEREAGSAILAEDLNPAKLRTLNLIYEHFFRRTDE